MFSRSLSSLIRSLLAVLSLALLHHPAVASSALRVCADPDNLPFSDRAHAGFDDRIAALVARDLHRQLIFIWARSRRGFLREQFNKNACDVLLGVPVGTREVAVTEPYYTSSYTFVSPTRKHLQIASFTDEHLNGQRIGLQILEEDLSPPSLPLIRSGHAGQIVGFESFGRQEGDVVKAVADGRVGVAIVWGPVAGYFAHSSPVPLTVTPISRGYSFSGIPFTYSMGFGVHKQDRPLLEELNDSIRKLHPKINQVLAAFAVPTADAAEEAR
ncbi:MAG TPA: quinoprotein dehydrogenase-associated putative ABC transporter substrate-binding protein [Acidobacteriaceae bacterium]|nr:quinoprotein dehydrogenase-associated putative ABC transporter substrate-binding protein [Acidobacteriaceae bacterium]